MHMTVFMLKFQLLQQLLLGKCWPLSLHAAMAVNLYD